MAFGTDRVQLLKWESAAEGGSPADEHEYPSGIEPQEDAIECAGVYFNDLTARDQQVGVARDAGNLIFKDVANPTPVTLTDLLAGGGSVVPPTEYGQIFASPDGSSYNWYRPLTTNEGILIDLNGVVVLAG